MATMEVTRLSTALQPAALWPEVAHRVVGWLQERALSPRDAVLLLPYSALLPLARSAFAAMGGWQPRIETPLTLSQRLAPPERAQPGAVTGDEVLDRLTAMESLLARPWARSWSQRDPRAFHYLVTALVDAAQALARAAAAHPPAQRAAFFAAARDSVPAAHGAGALENGLLAVAVEWAAASPAAPTDALWDLQPSAWMTVRIGGADALTEGLLAASRVPALALDADPPAADPFAAFVAPDTFRPPQRWICDGAEAEAQAAAALIIEALNDGRTPVALVSLDRMLVRRIRALLVRQSVLVSDETGWRLSTTDGAARVMALLRAAAPHASADARLEWLKTEPRGTDDDGRWIRTLELKWRGVRRAGPADEQSIALRRWQQHEARLQVLAHGRERSLLDWLADLESALRGGDCAPGAVLDEPLRRALRFGAQDAPWLEAAARHRLGLSDFTAWVDRVLEAANLEPAPQPDAEVVLTPLSRAVGRPWGHVVVPGADQARLGSLSTAPSLIGEAMSAKLGIAGARDRQLRERLAFAQLLRLPSLSLLRRRLDGNEPLAASPLVEWLDATLAAAQQPWSEQAWAASLAPMARVSQPRPAPRAPQALPEILSASAVGALRECPYRFFARSVLRLSEVDEIDAPMVKRDYGDWLHAALHHFHRARRPGAQDDDLGLARAATLAAQELQLDAAQRLPFQASFEVFAPAYLAWLAQREAQGWLWHEGEVDYRAEPPELAPQRLHGRLDRVDHGPGQAVELIDYKTGNLQSLRSRVRQPLEDTQLAFYAALLQCATPQPHPLSAVYLALDDPKAPVAVAHDHVAQTAEAFIAGLAQDFAALRAGAAMPALGEGSVCDTCEARGLCRRDHWHDEGGGRS